MPAMRVGVTAGRVSMGMMKMRVRKITLRMLMPECGGSRHQRRHGQQRRGREKSKSNAFDHWEWRARLGIIVVSSTARSETAGRRAHAGLRAITTVQPGPSLGHCQLAGSNGSADLCTHKRSLPSLHL